MAGSDNDNYSVIMKDGNISYAIPLDELDAAILSVDKFLDKFRGKGSTSTLLWSLENAAPPEKHCDFNELNGEVCEFEVLAERNRPETQRDQNAQDFFCHICKIFVRKTHTSAHYKSKNHGIMLKIALNALERINKHMMQHNMHLSLAADQDKDGISSPYCAVCNTTIAVSYKDNHEKDSKHQILLKREELLAKLCNLYEGLDENVASNTEGVSDTVPSNKESIVTHDHNNDKENEVDNECNPSNVQTDFDLTNAGKLIAIIPAIKKGSSNQNNKCGGSEIKTEHKKETYHCPASIETPKIKPLNVKCSQIETKLPFYNCTICDVSVPSNKENIVEHNSGKAHKKNMNKNANRHIAKPDVDVVDTKKPLKEIPADKTGVQCIPHSKQKFGKNLPRMKERDSSWKYGHVTKTSTNDGINQQAIRSIATYNDNLAELNAVTNVTATDCVSANKLKNDYPKENELSNVIYNFEKVYDIPLTLEEHDGCVLSLIWLSYQGLFTENFTILGRIRCSVCQWPIHLKKVDVDRHILEQKILSTKNHGSKTLIVHPKHPNCAHSYNCIVCFTILIHIKNHLRSEEHAEEWFEDNFGISVTTLINIPNGNGYKIPKLHLHGLGDVIAEGVHCRLCDTFVALVDVREHVSSMKHNYNMNMTYDYQSTNLDRDNLIRRLKVRPARHCMLCNEIIGYFDEAIFSHIRTTAHQNNEKMFIYIRKLPKKNGLSISKKFLLVGVFSLLTVLWFNKGQ